MASRKQHNREAELAALRREIAHAQWQAAARIWQRELAIWQDEKRRRRAPEEEETQRLKVGESYIAQRAAYEAIDKAGKHDDSRTGTKEAQPQAAAGDSVAC
jgi:hypothetical protein